MLIKLRILKLFSFPKSNVNQFHYLLTNPLCSKVNSTVLAESPVLPYRAKPRTGGKHDDFIFPSLAGWVESYLPSGSQIAVKEIRTTIESDSDKISKILKNTFKSPEDVAKALDGCDFDLSYTTVEQVLQRFSNVWVPAWGFFKWAKEKKGYDHSHELYNLMVDILGKCRKFELMWGLVEEMNDSGGHVSLDTMTKVLRRLARSRMFKESVDVFRDIERFGVKKDISLLNAFLQVLVKENNVDLANEVFLEFRESIPPNDRTFISLIHGWCKLKQLDKATKCAEEMERCGFLKGVHSYTCFIEAYSRDKNFTKVTALLNEMKEKGVKPSIVTYTTLMLALGKSNQIKEALSIYEEMKVRGYVPDPLFYNSMIFIFGKAGRLKDSLDVFADMAKQGVRPDAATYNALIVCACDQLQEEMALKFLKQMEEDSCKTTIETYAPLLKMCCKKKRMRVLEFLLNHMFSNDVSIDVGIYSLLINGLCKSGKLEQACFYFEEMVSKGMVPMDSPYESLKKELEAKSMVEIKMKIEKLMSQAKLRRS